MRRATFVGFSLLASAVCVLCVVSARAAEPQLKLSLDLGDGVKLDLALIPSDTFEQGSPADEPGRSGDETQRKVSITQPFYLGIYPVTRGQFARFVRVTHYRTEAEGGTSGGFGWDGKALVQKKEFNWRHPGFEQTDEHPVTLVTYPDAQAFLKWLSRVSGRHCALPSEAQWEYACRAGTTTPWYHESPDEIAWFKTNAGDGTRPVGQKQANAFGLFDMSGSVYEWCEDWFGPYPPGHTADPVQTNSNLSDKPRRVLRGGSWLKDASKIRSAARYRNDARSRNADNGFRVMASVQAVAAAAPHTAPPVKSPPASVPPADTPRSDVTPSPAESHSQAPDPAFPQPQPPMAAQPGIETTSWLCPAVVVLGALAVFALLMRTFNRRSSNRELEEFNRLQRGPQPGKLASGQSGKRPAAGHPPASPTAKEQAAPIRQVTSDGFWLGFMAGQIGSTVRYRYLVNGQPRIGEAVIGPDPQGTFVYTGDTPDDVQLLGIDPADDDLGNLGLGQSGSHRPSSPASRPGTHRPSSSPPPKRSGFPPAY